VTRKALHEERENLRIQISLDEERGVSASGLRKKLDAIEHELAAATVSDAPIKRRRKRGLPKA
jgi:hypothetical protein